MIELLERVEQVRDTPGKPIKLPHQDTGELMLPRGSHERLELRTPLLTSGHRSIEIFGDNLEAGAGGIPV
jgi:hypothetical protein